MAIKKLNNYRSARPDNKNAKFLKVDEPKLSTVIHGVIIKTGNVCKFFRTARYMIYTPRIVVQ